MMQGVLRCSQICWSVVVHQILYLVSYGILYHRVNFSNDNFYEQVCKSSHLNLRIQMPIIETKLGLFCVSSILL
jgi:hypothetical protein